MLSRTHRFHGYGSLGFVYRQGRHVHGPSITLRYFLNQRRRTYRCAVVIGKKTEKSAVQRNRIRRRIYEVIRSHEAGINQAYDIVITVLKPGLGVIPSQELSDQIGQLLTQAKIITK